jgi:hypothetical protein
VCTIVEGVSEGVSDGVRVGVRVDVNARVNGRVDRRCERGRVACQMRVRQVGGDEDGDTVRGKRSSVVPRIAPRRSSSSVIGAPLSSYLVVARVATGKMR